MPDISHYQSTQPVKALYLGDSGAGKTGSLVSLIKAGYRVRVIDFDNGIGTLIHYILKECPERANDFFYYTATDKLRNVNGRALLQGPATAFTRALQMMTHWKVPDGEDLGPPSEWGRDHVLVIDSLTHCSHAAHRLDSSLNGEGGALENGPHGSIAGQAQTRVEAMLGLLYSAEFKTNVIVTAHIRLIEGEIDGARKGLPMCVGSKLPPVVGTYFNNAILAKTVGSGESARHVIKTVSEGIIELKTETPLDMPKEFPLSTGLADFFKVVTGGYEPGKKEEAA